VNGTAMKTLLISYLHGEGGVQVHTMTLAAGLAGRDHQVAILTPPPLPGHQAVAAAGVPVATYASLPDAVRKARACRPDVVVVTGTGWKAMLAALAARRARRVFFEVMSGERNGRRDPRILVHAGFHAVVGQAGPVQRRFCEEFGWRGAATTIPALPHPLEHAAPIPARAAAALGPGAPVRFAYFGRLDAHKNVALLIARFRDYAPPGSTLDVWGSGPATPALVAQASAAGLGDAVRLHGRYRAGAAYVALLQRYDLLLLPTVGREGAPLVLLEAMAAGLPFVANGVGGISDYGNPDCALTDGRIDAFVPLVRAMVARLQQGSVDTLRLQRHYRMNFANGVLVERWEEVLRALLAAGAGPPRRGRAGR
jgi:glycosyltransferase involved in cell wall biosynthesis